MVLRRFFLCISLLTPAVRSIAQDFSYPTATVRHVTFAGGNLSIRKDDGTGHWGAPQFSTDSAMAAPVAYSAGSTPKVGAGFLITCPAAPDSVWIRGLAPDTTLFAPAHVAVAGGSGAYTATYPATLASHPFALNTVRFFKPYAIAWQISFDGTKWYAADSSANTLYVTRGAPQAESGSYKWYHSVYDLSCRNATGETTDTGIISKVWSEFPDHVVLNWAGDSLFYYQSMATFNTTLGSLLKYKDAQCYTFAQLFLSLIKIQGVIRGSNYVFITPASNTVCGYTVNRFLVKNWTFGMPTASSTCAQFPYVNTYIGTLIPSPYTAYAFTTADVTDTIGAPGSCTANPASYFNNHQIAKIDGKYYDACYGTVFTNLTDYTAASFSGWSFRYTTGGTTYAHFTADLTQSYLSETISTF